jgi:hypothetical protein
MKRILTLISVLTIISMLIIPYGAAVADQAFHTVRAPFHSLDESAYPLKNGFVVATHMNGSVNFEKKEFQLHGAKPNTQFFIYRVFAEDLHRTVPPTLIPAGTPIYSGLSFWTDEHGNGHIMTPLAPTDPALNAIEGTVSLHITNVLYDGLLPPFGTGGTKAYQADEYETFFDWKW